MTSLISHLAFAQSQVHYHVAENHIILSDLSSSQRRFLEQEPDRVRIQLKSATVSRGMLINVENSDDALYIHPHFPLKMASQYTLQISLADGESHTYDINVPQGSQTAPALLSFSPSQSVIPANTLRMHVTFSEPMASGQVKDKIVLMQSNDRVIQSPFLNLDKELWDQSQTRLTLLFDPGRIKQGVGPNLVRGAPLVPGKSYKIVISREFKSAAGIAIGRIKTITFDVGNPVRSQIDTNNWSIVIPQAKTTEPLVVSFDRIMDTAKIERSIQLYNPAGERVNGLTFSDGGGWSITPQKPWQNGHYQIKIDPSLEDVSGNTLYHPFDSVSGSVKHTYRTRPLSITLHIAS